jgi:hypothetical protein
MTTAINFLVANDCRVETERFLRAFDFRASEAR